MVILGLGKAGSNIANLFKVDDNYKVFTYDEGKGITAQPSSEEYEKKFTKKKQIKDNNINVVYIIPDLSIMSDMANKRNKVGFNILQQFARSGLINSLYLVSNESMMAIVGEAPLISYYNKMNELLFNCIHSLNVYADTEPVFGGNHEPKEVSRIRTFAFREIEKEQKKLFFPLDNTTEACYIYSINETELSRNSNLISEIKSTLEDNVVSSFSIYKSSHEHSYAYGIYYTHYIQSLEGK